MSDREEINNEDFPIGQWKVEQHWGDFLDGIEGVIYHYKDEPILPDKKPEIESYHPWEQSDIICCERCKILFDL